MSLAVLMNCASSSVRRCRSGRSKIPSARRRKKRGMPFSNTGPRGLSRAASGKSIRPRSIKSFSSPPVPCNSSSVTLVVLFLAGRKRWIKPPASCISELIFISLLAADFIVGNMYRGNALFDHCSLRFQPWGKFEMCPQLFGCFIDWEAWLVSCDLEENTTGLTEIDGVEVGSVENGCDLGSSLKQFFAPIQLLFVIGCTPCDMVNGAD